MPYIIISTVALLSNLYKNAPLIVGDKDSDPELMRYLGARITTNYPACGSPPMYVMHAPPRAVFDNLEKRGYCLLSAQTIQEHTVWILARPRNPEDDRTEIAKGGPNDKSIQAFEGENGKSLPPQGATSSKSPPPDSVGTPASPASLQPSTSTQRQETVGTPASQTPLITPPQGAISSKTSGYKSVPTENQSPHTFKLTSEGSRLREKEVDENGPRPLLQPKKTVHSRGTSPTENQNPHKFKDFEDDRESLIETSSQTSYLPEKKSFSAKKSIILKETNETVELKELVSIQPKREKTQNQHFTPRTKSNSQKVEKREERPITPTKKHIALKADVAPKRRIKEDKVGEMSPSENETDAANIASKGDASAEWLENEKVHTRIQVYDSDVSACDATKYPPTFASVINSKGTTAIAEDIEETRKHLSSKSQANLSSQMLVFANGIWEHRNKSGSLLSFSMEEVTKKFYDVKPLMLDSWTQMHSYMSKEPQICVPKQTHLVSSCIGGPSYTLLENPIFAHTNLKHLACLTQECCCCED